MPPMIESEIKEILDQIEKLEELVENNKQDVIYLVVEWGNSKYYSPLDYESTPELFERLGISGHNTEYQRTTKTIETSRLYTQLKRLV